MSLKQTLNVILNEYFYQCFFGLPWEKSTQEIAVSRSNEKKISVKGSYSNKIEIESSLFRYSFRSVHLHCFAFVKFMYVSFKSTFLFLWESRPAPYMTDLICPAWVR